MTNCTPQDIQAALDWVTDRIKFWESCKKPNHPNAEFIDDQLVIMLTIRSLLQSHAQDSPSECRCVTDNIYKRERDMKKSVSCPVCEPKIRKFASSKFDAPESCSPENTVFEKQKSLIVENKKQMTVDGGLK